MELSRLIEQIESEDQDFVLAALQLHNTENSQRFLFDVEDRELRQYLSDSVNSKVGWQNSMCPNLSLNNCFTDEDDPETRQIGDQVFGAGFAASMPGGLFGDSAHSIRDKNNLRPFTTRGAMRTLARHAGIDYSEERMDGMPDVDVIVEALKCLCNVVFNSPTAQAISAESCMVLGLTERLKLYNGKNLTHDIKFFDCRLLFLLTALRLDIRRQLGHELRGVSLLTDALESTLGVRWSDTYEVATDGPPLAVNKTDCAMEILKILFNITFDLNKREVDEEDAALYRHLVAILRHCLLVKADGEDRTEELPQSHGVNLLGNLPLMCLDVLLTPRVQLGSVEYMGMNMDAVNLLLEFLEKRLDRIQPDLLSFSSIFSLYLFCVWKNEISLKHLKILKELDRGHKLRETLIPALNLLTESARAHRETRKFLRMRVLPPLRDVQTRPEVGNLLRNKLVRLMTHIDTDLKHCAAEFLFVLCKESVARFVKYTGYGNAAGLLAARGLMGGRTVEGMYSEDEDTDTEEYKEAKPNINPVTGRVEERAVNPMDEMTDEQKEYEAMKLFNMFDKLSREQIIQPMGVTPDGKLAPLDEMMQHMVEVRETSDSDTDSD